MVSIQDQYWAITHRAAKILACVPFIKLVGVNGSLATGHIKRRSDIDIVIVARAGRIWTVRFFTVILLKIIGQYPAGRPGPERSRKGKLCPNTFLTDRSFNLRPVKRANDRLVALSNLVLVPLVDRDNGYQKFINANRWMIRFGKFSAQGETSPPRGGNFDYDQIRLSIRPRGIGEGILAGAFGNWLEKILKNYQLARIQRDPRTNQPGSEQVATEKKIHFEDRI